MTFFTQNICYIHWVRACVCVKRMYIHITVSPTEISQRFLSGFLLPSQFPLNRTGLFYLTFSLSDTRKNLNSILSPMASLMYLPLFTFPLLVESDGNPFRAFSFLSESETFVLLIELSFISISNPGMLLDNSVRSKGRPSCNLIIKTV